MSARAEFDVGPLSWVKGEIDHAIEHSQQALRAFAANSADAAQLKSSQSHLHQAHGALSIVGLEGITRVSEELEGLLGAIEREVSLRKTDIFGLAERALGGIRAYLDQLMAGRPNQPLRLFPLYRDVVSAMGGRADPTDLYYPNLSFRPPKRDKTTGLLKPGESDKYLREQRGRYQRGLLKWLKKDASGAEDMRAAVEAIDSAQGVGAQRAFWWVSLAFFDALAHDALPPDLDTKALCNRIEQQIKRLVDGVPSVAERLMREVLYYVARAKPETQLLREVHEAYHLAQSIPQTEGEGTTAVDSPALQSAREHLSHAKDVWNKCASGNASALLAFRDSSAALTLQVGLLGDPELSGLTDAVAEIAEWLVSNRDKMNEGIALEVATVLLMLESALAGPRGQFSEQARVLSSRLQDCIQGRLEPKAPDIPLLDEMSRKAAERLVMNQVVSEMQANLRAIEQVLDLFFRDSTRRDDLASLDKPMRQLLGALEMLGEKRAQEALGVAAEEIRRFSNPDRRPKPQDFERVAQTLSGLGFYIEGLAHGGADFDAAMRPIAAPEKEERDAGRQAPSVEAHIAEQQRETAGVYEEWKDKPEDAELRAELKKSLAALKKDAGLVADQKLEASAAEALKALDKSATMPLTPFLREAVEKATSTAVPSPSPEATKLIDASAEAVDAELLGVYLEESDEVLASIQEQLDIVREQHANKEALVTIRRGFHTLKGSGRMVGLMRLGEAAWAIEQTMNTWLQDERAATPALLQLIGLAHEYFSDNVKRLKAGGSSSDERALVAAAERVRRGESPERAPAPEATPASAPAEPSDLTFTDESAPSGPAELDGFVQLGSNRVSTTLFTIFSGEAREHISAIKAEHETLRQHGVVSDALLRAVHTLAGTSGTVKISALSDLGYALERALQVLANSELSEAEQLMVGEAIDTLEAMVAGVVELRVLQPVPALIALLDRVGAGADAAPRTSPEQGAPETVPSYAGKAEPAAPEAEPAALEDEPAALEDEPATEISLEDLDAQTSLERRQRRLDDDLDPELMQIFLDEAHELVPSVGSALRDWRDAPDNPALGQALQRVLHTLKGSARMAGAMAMGELTHHMETRVENALSVKILPAALFEELETSWDRMGFLFERLQKGGAAAAPEPAAAAPAAEPPLEIEQIRPAAAVPVFAPAEAKPAPVEAGAPKPVPPSERELQPKALLRVRADVVDRLVNQAGEVAIARSRIEGEMRTLKGAMQELTDNVLRLRAQLREIEIQAESQMQSRLELAKETQRGFDPLEFDRFTRFQEVTRLMAESVSDVSTVHGNLVNTVDETEKALLAQARLNRDLQQDLMRVRMVPFGSLQERLYRIVRQTGKEVGKRANLEIKGTQVELDRSVLERITGPFEHLLRNAITHGIESPAKRREAGKAEIGEIRLELRQEGNEVQLALSDDGAGLNIERIREKAIEKGLMQANSDLSEAEIADFIFNAGFSTAEEISQVAGRGVGMDVVRSEVAALGGRVEMKFAKGQGTRFTIYLPLTLAVTQTVLVRAGAKTYAIPAVMVEQVLQLRQEQLVAAYSSRQTVWQDRHYPFHYLPHLLGISEAVAEQKRFSPTLYLRSGTNSIALHVDDMVGSNQEIVVKSIGPQLQRIAGITGATVLGTGEIVLILNPVQLALKEIEARSAIVHEAPKPQAAATQPTIMVVDDSLTVRKVTGRLLERQGYLVVTARDGVEAMEKLQTLVPDVMLVDIEMPRMDGFDLTRNVRADARLARVPVIMITSRTADKHQNYAREIGVSHFLGKPYQEDDLLEKISGFLRTRKAAA